MPITIWQEIMPFMDAPPGSALSTKVVGLWGGVLRRLRAITNTTVNKEPKWRHPRAELTTGYEPINYARN